MDGNIVSANTKNVHKFTLHQKMRSVLFLIVIGVPVFIGAFAYITYQDMTNPQNETNLAGSDVVLDNPEAINQSTSEENLQPPTTEVTPPAPPSVETPAQSPGASPQRAQPPTSAQSSRLPDGLITALNSIETNGLKGSAYVSSSFDTSSIPDGTSISFDRSSWIKESDTSGTVSGNVFLFGQPQNGSVRFAESSGVWRATGYALN